MNSPSTRLVVIIAVLLAVVPAVGAAYSPSTAPAASQAGADADSGIQSSLVQQDNKSDDAADNESKAKVTDIGFNGDADLPSKSVQDSDNKTFLWSTGNFSTNVTFTVPSDNASGSYETCLQFVGPDKASSNEPHCKKSPSSHGQYTVTFTFANWTFGPPGEYDSQAYLAQSSIDGRTKGNVTNSTVVVLEKSTDYDSDGLTNEEEVVEGTYVNAQDSDSDSLHDGQEVQSNTNPLNQDTDGDGLPDGEEMSKTTNATNVDTDGDGLSDGEEVKAGTDPKSEDSDGDGLSDSEETNGALAEEYPDLEPLNEDSDGDGLSDGQEVNELDSNPTKEDTDGDLLSDNTEYELGTDPASAFSPFGWVLLALFALLLGAVYLMRRGIIPAPELPTWSRGSSSSGNGAMIAGRPETDGADEEPLTDSEHVRDLIETNGGQIRQSRIVEETGWSKAMVSRVLSRMDDNNEISKIRIGRENLICLPGHEPPSMRQ